MPDEKRKPPRHLADSQQLLAASIAREVQKLLPQHGAPDEAAIQRSVGDALLKEARSNELTIAYLRSAAVLCYTLLNAFSYFQPKFAGVREFPATLTLLTFVWLCGSIAVVVPLRKGWFARWMRFVMPVADTLLISLTFYLLDQQYEAAGLPLPAGVTASAVAACLFVAFSGSMRLSKTGGQISTGLALLTWLFVAVIAGIGGPGAAFIGAMLVAIGLLGLRITSIAREVAKVGASRERLAAMYETAEQTIAAREQVLNLVAHDLRNPLSTISGAAGLLLEMNSDTQVIRMMEKTLRSVDAMNRIIGDLLDVARSEAGTLSMDFADVSTTDLLADVDESMKPFVEREKRIFNIVAEDVPRTVRADRGRIAQVFSNLVGNATKFTPVGGSVTVHYSATDSRVRFSVIDTGRGMTDEQKRQAFGDFWQANQGDKRGIGLGLTIAKSIVEAHNGTIDIDPSLGVGQGTAFRFTLPLAGTQPGLDDKPGGPPDS
jgi:signal transduction histidine kinase